MAGDDELISDDTYPILHYFHSATPMTAFPLRLAVLDEALTIIECGLDPDARPAVSSTRLAHGAVDRLLTVLADKSVRTGSSQPPPSPDLTTLRGHSVPVGDQRLFEEAVAGLAQHRSQIAAFVTHSRWSWDDVTGARRRPASSDGAAHLGEDGESPA